MRNKEQLIKWLLRILSCLIASLGTAAGVSAAVRSGVITF